MDETLVVSRPLGRSGLTISRVALGCGNFGGVGSAPAFFGQGLTQDQAFELMDAAWEFGLTHFDTADASAVAAARRRSAAGSPPAASGRSSPPRPTTRWGPARTTA